MIQSCFHDIVIHFWGHIRKYFYLKIIQLKEINGKGERGVCWRSMKMHSTYLNKDNLQWMKLKNKQTRKHLSASFLSRLLLLHNMILFFHQEYDLKTNHHQIIQEFDCLSDCKSSWLWLSTIRSLHFDKKLALTLQVLQWHHLLF